MILHTFRSCLIWKPESVSFIQAVKEIKDSFKSDENYITEENVKSHFEYIYIFKKIQSLLTNFIKYDLETHNTERARPSVFFLIESTS